ncbi:outer membrane protein [Piscirickettsia salmonis]|nr:outer membrane beta-barrel protein [Piscirickettsia salmonis]
MTTLLISASALAAKPGAYIGLNLGYGGMDTAQLTKNSFRNEASSSASLRGFAGRINAGYLWSQSSLNYGIELGYATYANNQYSALGKNGEKYNFTYKGYNIDLLGIAQYNFNPNWNIFAKVGIAYASQTTSGSSEFSHMFANKGRLLPKVALGLGYEFTNGIGLNLTASHIFGNQSTFDGNNNQTIKNNLNKVSPVDMVTVGISYNF